MKVALSPAIVAAVAVFALRGVSRAQQVPEQSAPTSQAAVDSMTTTAAVHSPFGVRAGGAFAPRSDLSGGGGVARDSWTAAARVRVPLANNLFATAGASYTGAFYQFSGEPRIGGSDHPWSQVDKVTVSTGLLARIDARWSAFGGFRVNASAETGADWGESFTYGGVAGATYRFSDRLSLGLGIVAHSRLEEGALVFPFPVFTYVPPVDHDRWRLFCSASGIGGALGENGAGVAAGVAYAATPKLTLAAGLSGLGLVNDFRLSPGAPVPGGVVRDHFTQLMVEADWRPLAGLSTAAFIGVDLPGKLDVLSRDGSTAYSSDFTATPVVGVTIEYRF
ncbi:MAG TPA: hypothetical protein VGI81_07440 [Tepidisphaeraceae bacterium]|jgi:hypothetical protein